MSNLYWVTPIGSIANVLAGVPITINILAGDTIHNGANITYSIISGTLPLGLTLNSTGIINGTPVIDDTYNYASFTKYSFVVRAKSDNGYIIDGSFNINLSNVVNNNFNWVTPAGDLGTLPNGQYYSLQLQADTSAGSDGIIYSLISGELPYGMQFLPTGYIQGVPTFLNPIGVNQSQTYRFSVRATSKIGHVIDQSFSLGVTNVYGPIIEPTASNLGSFFDGTFYQQQLIVNELNPAVNIEWRLKDGTLPAGVVLSNTGLLSGYLQPVQLVGQYGPVGYDGQLVEGQILTAGNLAIGETYTIQSIGNTDFTVYGAISNTIGVDFVATGIGYGTGTVLWNGVVTQQEEFDSAPYDFNELSQSVTYNFTIEAFDGANYATQKYIVSVVSRSTFTADNTTDLVNDTFLSVDSNNIYTPVLLDNIRVLPTGRQDSYYAYKFQGFDFAGDTITYALANTTGTFDTYITGIDAGFDYAGFDSYVSTGSSAILLPGIILDAQSGWIYGKLDPQSAALTEFKIGVQVSKTVNGRQYLSNPYYFTLPILGDVNNTIIWNTPSDLGSIDNGSVSELYVEAHSPLNKPLVYTIVDEAMVPAKLPQGISLISDTVNEIGLLSGRVSFEAFSIDQYTTTFDGNALTIDKICTFTVEASTVDGSASSRKTFTVSVNTIDRNPYVNLYLDAMPAHDQRAIYNSIISDTDIFDPNILYRPSDPWFGVNDKIEMLFLPGLTSTTLNEYEQAIAKNHWTKSYDFDSIHTAVVLDEYYNVKYEVVYVQMLDPLENTNGEGPPLKIDLTNNIANPYISTTGDQYKIIYPNTSTNMMDRLLTTVGYYDQSSLPPWMTSNQLGTSNLATFNPPLGFIKAVVLAYTKPGAGKLVAYRLKNAGINFNNINFTVDRYSVDNYYSTNFQNNTWIQGTQTTFDSLPKNNVGTIVADVNYAITVPFAQINGRPVSYINANGGLDGVKTFESGQTLIFAKQEGFLNPGPYDGWVNYTDAFIGDNIITPSIEGYDSESYDTYNTIPGFLENAQAGTVTITAPGNQKIFNFSGTTTSQYPSFVLLLKSASTPAFPDGQNILPDYPYTITGNTITFTTAPPMGSTMILELIPNCRGGVWKINIINNEVHLSFVKQVNANQRVQILDGKSFASSILYYNPIFKIGQSVPEYTMFQLSLNAITTPTTFNAKTTKFFSRRDQYYTPGKFNQYVKFPQDGPFV